MIIKEQDALMTFREENNGISDVVRVYKMQAPIDDMVNYVRGLIAVAVNEPDTIYQRHIDTSIGLSGNDIVYRYKDEYVSTIGRIREDIVELDLISETGDYIDVNLNDIVELTDDIEKWRNNR